MDIVTYLVLTTSYYTQQQMKAFKSLNAFKYFDAGFVIECGALKIDKMIVVIGKVKHSQRMNQPPVNVWVMYKEVLLNYFIILCFYNISISYTCYKIFRTYSSKFKFFF